LKVGDFVVIRDERLGRIERVNDEWYQVRALMAHRRWAVHTSARRRDELELASHDYVRAKLGLEVGTAATVSLAAAPAVSAAAEAWPPAPRKPILHRASPAAERSLAARVLNTTTIPPPPAPARPRPKPMPAGQLSELFSTVAYPQPFRRYQLLALEAFEKARSEGRRRAYIVMPPGSGKTLLGLEIARRLGNRTLCLGPNTAIQSQWVDQWRAFQPATISAGIDPDLESPFTALTYQALCDIDAHNPDLEEQVVALQASDSGDRYISANLRRHLRLVALQGGGREELAGGEVSRGPPDAAARRSWRCGCRDRDRYHGDPGRRHRRLLLPSLGRNAAIPDRVSKRRGGVPADLPLADGRPRG